MWRRRDWLSWVGRAAPAGYSVLTLGWPALAHGASILAVRLWPAADYTRLTLESDTPLSSRHFITPDGTPRLVVEIEGLELDAALKELVGKVRADDPYVAGIRVGQFQPKVVRLVLDLKQSVKPQQFTLLPTAPYQHRLVLDLYPTVEKDPLLELIREKEAAERKAAQSIQDALGDFIDRLERPGERSGEKPSERPSVKPPAPVQTPAPAPDIEPSDSHLKEVANRLVIVALDPGHGGEDPGAIGPTGLREKDVVLQIALQLRDRLHQVRGLRVMMTRDADFFVPLHERVRKARRVQADLFVSIHADAFMQPGARGASVFALSSGAASSATARWMASRENAADAVGGVNVSAKDPQVLQALLDMSTSAQIKDSLKLGNEVLSRLGRVGRLHKGHVEQAGFAVLKAPDVPSILVETAFISNPTEEAHLKDPEYRAQLVEALYTGIRRYFARNPPLARPRSL